jgi:hypothetical protein
MLSASCREHGAKPQQDSTALSARETRTASGLGKPNAAVRQRLKIIICDDYADVPACRRSGRIHVPNPDGIHRSHLPNNADSSPVEQVPLPQPSVALAVLVAQPVVEPSSRLDRLEAEQRGQQAHSSFPNRLVEEEPSGQLLRFPSSGQR